MLIKRLMTFGNQIYTSILPYHCVLCGNLSTRKQDLCEPCYQDLPLLTHSCPRCAKVFLHEVPSSICGACLKSTLAFQKTFALFIYQAPITQLIINLKFHHALINARILGELLAEQIQQHWYKKTALPEAIFPVPLHADRIKQRGFNQSIEIAKPIEKQLNIPIDYHSCLRTKNTFAQATLSATRRLQNTQHAFKLIKPIPYKHIAVIDDVITTSNTIKAFCQTLKQGKVEQIDVWSCARAAYL
jgi:ComF family protein